MQRRDAEFINGLLRRRALLLGVLKLVKLAIEAAFCEELLVGAALADLALMNAKRLVVELYEPVLHEGLSDVAKSIDQLALQLPISNVSCCDQEEPSRYIMDEKGVHKVTVLCNQNAILFIGDANKFLIRGSVSIGQIQSVERIMTTTIQGMGDPPWQLRVN